MAFAPWQYALLLAIESLADPWGLFVCGLPMTRAAILIDGGYLLKRLPSVRPDLDATDPAVVAKAIGRLVETHLDRLNRVARLPHRMALLYRCFYYDAKPYLLKGHLPVSRRAIDFAKTPEATFRLALFNELRRSPNFVVRLGEVRRESGWILKEEPLKSLLAHRSNVDDLTDGDFALGLRQKAVDMRIGVDIASLTLKKQVDTIILVAGDADFVPAAKMARREGVRFILDPLWRSVAPDLFEHIDGLTSGFPRPRVAKAGNDEDIIA
ncbi:MAG: NYN domain-containing protein [Alphaproteobacteria bacterium]